jgi:predicted ester cyclase
MLADSTLVSSAIKDIAVRSIHIMSNGTRADFDALIHPLAIDRENTVQPPSSRVLGPTGFYSTALWLRASFAKLHYDIREVIASGDLVAVNSTMSGQHVAPMVLYTPEGKVDAAFPPTNKTFAMSQSHWFRVEDGKVIEHWANRDDMGHARQLGWLPPTPAYLIRMFLAKRNAERMR